MPAIRRLSFSLVPVLSLSVLLAACGGGGDSSPSSGGTATPSSPSASAPSTPSQLSGVAAFGAPLSGATLRVIDAQGRAVGTGVTNPADGSYSLVLSTATPALPLLVQAAGFDATGLPLLLHAAVATLSSATVLNITPLTEAAVALTMGADPKKVFSQPSSHTAALAALSKLTPASDFVKALVKANLTDARVGTITTLDLFGDSSFAATKAGVDLALETLSISVATNSLKRDQLQLANKLGAKQVEVTVDLANAAVELAKATGATPASAITSTVKATTSPTTLVARLPALDTLAVALNTAIAAGGSGSAVNTLTGSYVRHNGRDAGALTDLIATWAQQGTQLGRLQVLGCADTPAVTSGTGTGTGSGSSTTTTACTRVAVAARLSDTTGKEVGSFSDVVSYTTTGARWNLVGNGLPAEVTVRSIAWLSLSAEGARLADTTTAITNPRTGLQIGVQNTVSSATVLTPSNYVLSLIGCSLNWLCINPVTTNTEVPASGTPIDQSVFQGSSAWMGVADTTAGASYSFTLTPDSGSNITLPVALRSGFVEAPASARFPVLDGVKTGDAVSGAALLSGTRLAWATWAAANPDMRVTLVRMVLGDSNGGAPRVTELKPPRWQSSALDWAAVEVPDDYALGAVTLWLLAIDSAGREYNTSYAVVAAP